MMAVTTSMSGSPGSRTRWGRTGCLPREIDRLERRTLRLQRQAIAAIDDVAIVVVLIDVALGTSTGPRRARLVRCPPALHAGPTRRRPAPPPRADLARPSRPSPTFASEALAVPLPALVGAHADRGRLRARRASPTRARARGPAWLALGLVVFRLDAVARARACSRTSMPRTSFPVGASSGGILVPDGARRHRRGDGRDGHCGSRRRRTRRIEAMPVVKVRARGPFDAELPAGDVAESAAGVARRGRRARRGERRHRPCQRDQRTARSGMRW